MNLMINGIDAMKAVDGPRQLTLGTQNDSDEQLLSMRFSVFAGTTALALAVAPAAFAHAYLKQAQPTASTVVAPATSSLLLTFTEAVQPKFCTVTVTATWA